MSEAAADGLVELGFRTSDAAALGLTASGCALASREALDSMNAANATGSQCQVLISRAPVVGTPCTRYRQRSTGNSRGRNIPVRRPLLNSSSRQCAGRITACWRICLRSGNLLLGWPRAPGRPSRATAFEPQTGNDLRALI